MSWSLIQKSPIGCVYLRVRDPETSTMWQPRPKVDLQTFVAETLPDEDIIVPKHLRVGT
jgi:hypothetical protein